MPSLLFSDAANPVRIRYCPNPPGNVHRENRKLLSPVGEALSLPKCTQLSCSLNGSSFPTQTVGADRIRPQHKAPLQGACAGSTVSRPLQGVCVHPGTCGNPGLRAAISRPYRADAFIRVLAEIRGYGRLLAAPTGRMRSSGCLRKSWVAGICSRPSGKCSA